MSHLTVSLFLLQTKSCRCAKPWNGAGGSHWSELASEAAEGYRAMKGRFGKIWVAIINKIIEKRRNFELEIGLQIGN